MPHNIEPTLTKYPFRWRDAWETHLARNEAVRVLGKNSACVGPFTDAELALSVDLARFIRQSTGVRSFLRRQARMQSANHLQTEINLAKRYGKRPLQRPPNNLLKKSLEAYKIIGTETGRAKLPPKQF